LLTQASSNGAPPSHPQQRADAGGGDGVVAATDQEIAGASARQR
jgi:hypothetical protein